MLQCTPTAAPFLDPVNRLIADHRQAHKSMTLADEFDDDLIKQIVCRLAQCCCLVCGLWESPT